MYRIEPKPKVGQCRKRCPEGNPCCCDDNGHMLHICKDEDCPCHSRERYADAKRVRVRKA